VVFFFGGAAGVNEELSKTIIRYFETEEVLIKEM
jgi:hypothetical protein